MPRLDYKSGLPRSLGTKIYKTGQTRGAENDEIFQNRVLRNNTALIPLTVWCNDSFKIPENGFEKGLIVYASPNEYFSSNPPEPKPDLPNNLILGENLLIYYRSRAEWDQYTPNRYGWTYAKSRTSPLNGQYIARVPNTTSQEHNQIFEGFTGANSGGKGAGIRVYEYASKRVIERTWYQLAYLAWHTIGIDKLVHEPETDNPQEYKDFVISHCKKEGLDDQSRLEEARIMLKGQTVCPLCLEPIKAIEMCSRVEQALGREVLDLTVTTTNLFHIKELRPGYFNHREYNLGWGHHHCNTVARDMGIQKTLDWMVTVLQANGYTVTH